VEEYRYSFFGPQYAVYGRPAVLQLGVGTFEDLVAIDIVLETVRPHARMLRGDLDDRGILVEQLDGGSIALNGKVWTIMAHQAKPSPNGEADGEVWLMLEGAEG
jgi:hypothetical protein